MREAIGNTFIVNLILIFLVVMSILLIGSISYSKAFKVKNRIVYVLEKYGYWNSNSLSNDAKNEIDLSLKQIGYSLVMRNTSGQCNRYAKGGQVLYGNNPAEMTYRYCVIKFDNEKGSYYGVVSFMHFDIPLLGGILEFPVYGETKALYLVGDNFNN